MNVLAVGAHWDDLELGCCLTLGRLRRRGAKLYGCVLTDSETLIGNYAHHFRSASAAQAEGHKAFGLLGIERVQVGTDRCSELRYNKRAMNEIEGAVAELGIDIAFTHWPGDLNTDHAAAYEIVRVACRQVPTLLLFASNGYYRPTQQFAPQLFFGFGRDQYEMKLAAMQVHATEWAFRKDRWQREVFDRERVWGYQCGADYAEAFMVERAADLPDRGLIGWASASGR